jgi:SAM-dependent methyltransferase
MNIGISPKKGYTLTISNTNHAKPQYILMKQSGLSIFLTPAIKSLLRLHAFLGKVIDVLAIKANGGLHPKHHLMRYYKFFLENINSGDTVLDIGCGNGFVATQVAKKAGFVTGIDTDRNNIALAKKRALKNTDFIVGDATAYAFKKKYNAIILSNVLEHIENRIRFLQKVQLLADTILIRVPMIDRDWLPLYRKELGMFYFCDPTHFTEYTFESFRQEMVEAKLMIIFYTIRFGEIWAVVKKI